MANGDDGSDVVGSPGADATATGGPGGPPPGASPGGPPQGGGPILAAIANRQRGPQVSAPGPGDQASAHSLLLQAVGLMQQALHGFQAGSHEHTQVLGSLQRLSRMLGRGDQTGAGQQQTQLQDLLRNLVRNAMLMRIMQSQRGGQGGQPGGQPGGGPPQQAPMPSTPLPGA